MQNPVCAARLCYTAHTCYPARCRGRLCRSRERERERACRHNPYAICIKQPVTYFMRAKRTIFWTNSGGARSNFATPKAVFTIYENKVCSCNEKSRYFLPICAQGHSRAGQITAALMFYLSRELDKLQRASEFSLQRPQTAQIACKFARKSKHYEIYDTIWTKLYYITYTDILYIGLPLVFQLSVFKFSRALLIYYIYLFCDYHISRGILSQREISTGTIICRYTHSEIR